MLGIVVLHGVSYWFEVFGSLKLGTAIGGRLGTTAQASKLEFQQPRICWGKENGDYIIVGYILGV